jgi:predicted DCC family thiol-disulfide oxidoreductase YuxK
MNSYTEFQKHHQIILFDGVCNFCNKWVNLIIRLDTNKKFKFASLQSDKGQDILAKFGLSSNEFDTIYLFDGERMLKKSEAIINICGQLSGFWKLLQIFKIIPPQIRNFVYDLVAKNRYTFLSKSDNCQIPTAEQKERFL